MRVDDAETPAFGGWDGQVAAMEGGVVAGGEDGVGVGGVGGEGGVGVRVGLVVGCFGLDLAGEEGGGGEELVFVEDVAGWGRLVMSGFGGFWVLGGGTYCSTLVPTIHTGP